MAKRDRVWSRGDVAGLTNSVGGILGQRSWGRGVRIPKAMASVTEPMASAGAVLQVAGRV
jgi:hypothetical protein